MPFITEELWTRLPLARRDAESLCVAAWPTTDERYHDEAAAALCEQQIAVIQAVRTIRGENRISPRRELSIVVSAQDAATAALVEAAAGGLSLLANVATVEAGVDLPRPAKSAVAMAGACQVFVPLEGVVDLAEEASRLEKAIAKLDKDIDKLAQKLANERFVANAPAEVVAEQRARLAEAQAARQTYADNLAQLR
jgi:valyl-tRNA synthetase